MVCRGIFTPMTHSHRYMVSVVLIPPTSRLQHLRSVSTSCISDIIADWMKCNRLHLNSSKPELIWCSSSRRLKHLDCNPFVIGADAVQPKNEVRDLGLVLDIDPTMTSHITGLVRTSFAILRQLRSVSRSLTQDATRHHFGAKFDPEPNRLLQCRLCRLATTQHHSAPGSHQRCCSSDSASQKV